MNKFDYIVTLMGIVYGVLLILAAFVRNRVTESIRIDALLIPQPTDDTRPVNVLVGILFAGYSIYTLLTG